MIKPSLFLPTLFLVAGHATAAITLTDPGFGSALVASDGGVLPAETNAWHRNGTTGPAQSWVRTTTIIGPSGVTEGIARYNDSTQNNTDTRALMQVATGTIGETGLQTIRFDYLLNNADLVNNHDLQLRVEVFGISASGWTSGAFDLAMANSNANVTPEDDPTPGSFTSLLNSTAFTKTTASTITASTWQKASFAIDLGLSGYDQIGIRFTASDGGLSGTSATTVIAIDNVEIIPEPTTGLLSLLALTIPLVRRRR